MDAINRLSGVGFDYASSRQNPQIAATARKPEPPKEEAKPAAVQAIKEEAGAISGALDLEA